MKRKAQQKSLCHIHMKNQDNQTYCQEEGYYTDSRKANVTRPQDCYSAQNKSQVPVAKSQFARKISEINGTYGPCNQANIITKCFKTSTRSCKTRSWYRTCNQ